MNRIHSMAGLCLFLITIGAYAFPIQFPPVLTVTPWVPTPQQNTVITVSDVFGGLYPGPTFSLQSVQVSNIGNEYFINSRFVIDPQGQQSISFPLNLGLLAPGRYTVNYTQGETAGPYLLHPTILSFSVSEGGLIDALEYFNVTLGHYFISADPAEIIKLDQGTIVGWKRTGESFKVMSADTMPTNATAVCRFYGLPSAGLDSHFFSASQMECQQVQDRWPNQWVLETTNAFGIVGAANGPCRSDTTSLYRLYNNRADVNHRYTVSAQTRDAMIAQGWILEGNAPDNTSRDFVAMCLPK